MESKEKVPKILATKVSSLENVLDEVKEVNISIEKEKASLQRLKSILVSNKGKVPVSFTLNDSKLQGMKIKTAGEFHLLATKKVLEDISSVVGEENLSLVL